MLTHFLKTIYFWLFQCNWKVLDQSVSYDIQIKSRFNYKTVVTTKLAVCGSACLPVTRGV